MDETAPTPDPVIHTLRGRRVNNQSIARIASSFAFVRDDARIRRVQIELRDREELEALGVVDASGRTVGMIVRRDFFATMARPFAQDVFRNHTVREIMAAPRTFNVEQDLFTVADELEAAMRSPGVAYFALVDGDGAYGGAFSTQDLLVYLSQITQADIALARKLQSRIVREREFLVGNRLEVVSVSRTAKGVGGDFYEVRRYDEGRWVIAMCDVSGKGVAASIITSVLWGMMSIYDFRNGVVPFIRQLNNYLVRTFETEKFVTAIFADYDEATGVVELCDMGHSHIYLHRDGALGPIETHHANLPIGIVSDVDPEVDRLTPRPDDTLFLLTDGLIEQENEAGATYDIAKVEALFARHGTMPVEVLSDRLVEDFDTFRGRRPLTDDVTWSIMRFHDQEVTL